ncbi:MAG: hypothetical protein KBD56_03495 [Candidatus Eisenbacteria bacterium]|nr:hypothetical protein [Candidatus Eisenbacteria bacterium]
MLQRLARVEPEEWGRLKPLVVRSWEKRDGTWVIHRLVEEREKQEKKSEKARRSAKVSWESRTDQPSRERQANAERTHMQTHKRTHERTHKQTHMRTHMRSHCSPPLPTPTHSGEEEEKSSPLTPLTPWLTPAQKEELLHLIEEIHKRHPSQWPRFDAILRRWRRERKPWEVVAQALRSALVHEPQTIDAYMAKIMRVEEPNHYERESIARHQVLKAEEARERAGPWVNVGLVSVREILAGFEPKGNGDEEHQQGHGGEAAQ